MNVIIVKTNGERYETPVSNLENVRRLVKYSDIIYPGEETATKEITEEETIAPSKKEPVTAKPKAEVKAKAAKPIKS
jgi:hypothetical protein